MRGPGKIFRRLTISLQKRPLHWVGWAAGLLTFLLFVSPRRTHNPCDYYGFWIIGQSVESVPLTNVYAWGEGVRICQFAKANSGGPKSYLEKSFRRGITYLDSTGTPFLYSVFKLVSSGDFKKDYDRYRIFCAATYVLGILALASYLEFPWWSPPLIVAFFTVMFWPFRRDVIDANNSSALAGATAAGLLLLRFPEARWRVAAGFVLGLLAAFKPTILYAPALVMLVFALTDRRALISFVIGFVIAVAIAASVPAFVLGPACTWKHWWHAASGRVYAVRSLAGGVPGRFLHITNRLLYRDFTYAMFAVFAAIVWFLFRDALWWPTELFQERRSPRNFNVIAAGTLGLTCYLLSGPLVWGHYFTLAVPTTLVALRPRPYRPDRGWIAHSIALLACALLAFHGWFRMLEWTSWGNYSPLTFTGVVLVTAVTFWDLWDYRQWRPASLESASGDAERSSSTATV